jgi:dihydroorotate dehydrogenase
MAKMLFRLAQKALFVTDPETAHHLSLEALKLAHATGASALLCTTPQLPTECMGLSFANPVGLAAGLDKNGDYIDALGRLGFGFIEIGSVLPRPQPGNPKPRLFRIPEARAVINRMGFNSKGVDHTVRALERRRYPGILGINIGKNRDTPIEKAADDYLHCMKRVYPFADYLTVNISSPNTEGLRALQGIKLLDQLLSHLCSERNRLADEHGRCVPLLVKVAPDLDNNEIEPMAEVFVQHRIDGVAACNTTLARVGVENLRHGDEAGGLSGAPLKAAADQVLQRFRSHLPGSIALIGLGGITRGEDAADKVRLGADLVQFYTGMIYQGPDLIADSVRAIARLGSK